MRSIYLILLLSTASSQAGIVVEPQFQFRASRYIQAQDGPDASDESGSVLGPGAGLKLLYETPSFFAGLQGRFVSIDVSPTGSLIPPDQPDSQLTQVGLLGGIPSGSYLLWLGFDFFSQRRDVDALLSGFGFSLGASTGLDMGGLPVRLGLELQIEFFNSHEAGGTTLTYPQTFSSGVTVHPFTTFGVALTLGIPLSL